jgi:hypothetical protein
MTRQHYTTECTQQHEHPTSPWTETFASPMADDAHAQASQSVSSRPYDSDTQAPTHDALSDIYNRDY